MDGKHSSVAEAIDPNLDASERASIALALQVQPTLILIDGRRAVASAQRIGLVTIGTLGLLVRFARRNLLDLPLALDALRHSNCQ